MLTQDLLSQLRDLGQGIAPTLDVPTATQGPLEPKGTSHVRKGSLQGDIGSSHGNTEPFHLDEGTLLCRKRPLLD